MGILYILSPYDCQAANVEIKHIHLNVCFNPSDVVSPGRSRMNEQSGSNMHSCSNLGKRTWSILCNGPSHPQIKSQVDKSQYTLPVCFAHAQPVQYYYMFDVNFNGTSKYKFYNLNLNM